MALVSVPLGDLKFYFAPTLTVTALGIAAESLSRSPAFARKLARRRYGIESEDYFPVTSTGGLLSKASLELDGPLAWHPALRNIVATVGKTVPLACW